MSFITYSQPEPNGDDLETLGILINKSEDGTRGSVFLLNRNGSTAIMHNVPFEGQQVQDGIHIHLGPPSYLDTTEPPPEDAPLANGETTVNYGGS